MAEPQVTQEPEEQVPVAQSNGSRAAKTLGQYKLLVFNMSGRLSAVHALSHSWVTLWQVSVLKSSQKKRLIVF